MRIEESGERANSIIDIFKYYPQKAIYNQRVIYTRYDKITDSI